MPFGNDSAFPLHDDQIRKWSQRGYMMDFLKARASMSRSFECYDFNIKALDTTNQWTISATSTATTWAVLAEPGGWIRGVTGASVATGGLQIAIPTKYWTGAAVCGMASLIRVSAVTEVRVEQGFGDVLPANSVTAVNLASASFNSITTGAVALYDHTGSTTTSGLYTVGTSVAYSAVATTTNRYASAATLFVAVEIDGTTAKMWAGPPGGGPLAVKHAAISAADAFLMFAQVKTSGGSKNFDIDTFWTWSGRV